jgi:hypothetical protein
MAKHKYRVSQVTQDGQGWIALIEDSRIIARFSDWTEAKAAYRAVTR